MHYFRKSNDTKQPYTQRTDKVDCLVLFFSRWSTGLLERYEVCLLNPLTCRHRPTQIQLRLENSVQFGPSSPLVLSGKLEPGTKPPKRGLRFPFVISIKRVVRICMFQAVIFSSQLWRPLHQ
jgi:hypothetical protein